MRSAGVKVGVVAVSVVVAHESSFLVETNWFCDSVVSSQLSVFS